MKIPSIKFFTQKTSGPKALVCFDTHKNNASGRRHTTRDAHTHMGGGGGGFDTSQVWTSYGGWFADPKHWRRNTAVGFGIVFVASAYVFNVSRKLEKRPIYPHHRIPSQSWAPEGTFAKK